jgi:hypothetical protein
MVLLPQSEQNHRTGESVVDMIWMAFPLDEFMYQFFHKISAMQIKTEGRPPFFIL